MPLKSNRLTAVAIERALATPPPPARRLRRLRSPRLGAEFVRRRRVLGLSQEAVAAAVGCDRSFIGRWERGERTPNLPHFAALVAVLGGDPVLLLALAFEDHAAHHLATAPTATGGRGDHPCPSPPTSSSPAPAT